jgi:hypothetical protein
LATFGDPADPALLLLADRNFAVAGLVAQIAGSHADPADPRQERP